MIKKLVKGNKGIVVADALVAILVMTIFLGLISTLTYNIYISSSFTKRNSTAIDYGIKIIEYIDRMEYTDDLSTKNNIEEYINTTLDNNISTAENTPYKANIEIENYNQTDGNTGKQDLIKTITLTIRYKLGDADKEVTFKRIKQK